MSIYFTFTDEAGTYKGNDAVDKFRRSHPFYIRSNVLMKAEDYRVYQNDMNILNKQYEIPVDAEVKWDDLWALCKRRPRISAISRMSEDRLKDYYHTAFELAKRCSSLQFLFTITFVYDKSCLIKPVNVYKFHLQDAFRRISMELTKEDFAVFIMDEINSSTDAQIKGVCHEIAVRGDFLKYDNLYHGVLIENSIYSPGLQLADYAAGVFNGFLRRQFLNRGSYEFATYLFNTYIEPHIRHHSNGTKTGYGIIDVPGRPQVRQMLVKIFDAKS